MRSQGKADLPARYLAWQALDRVAQGQRVEQALERTLKGSAPEPRERALVWELVYGVCRWQNLLDHHLARFSKKPLTKLSPEVLTLLRIGAYQILKLDRIPDRAAVHATVEAASPKLPKWKTGFINAVLRALVKNRDNLKLPDQEVDPAEYLAVAESHPRWLVKRWLQEYGPEKARALLGADNRRTGLCLRINPLAGRRRDILDRLEEAGLEARPGEFSPQAVEIPKGSTALVEELLGRDGPALFKAQAQAAQTVAFLVDPRPGMRVLDLCAGVGGKTLHLAELSGGRGEITALEISPERAAAGREATARSGLPSIRYVQGDALKIGLDRLGGGRLFEAVLIDAPCSGSGVLASRPDIRWRLRPESPARMSLIQDRLLEAGAALTAPGGALVYATCSLFREENQDRIESFLDRHPEFVLEDPRPFLPPSIRPLVNDGGFLSTNPAVHGLDGFFGARMINSPKPKEEE